MSLYLLSFLAGVLTVLAPCVLPVLPVIIGGSVSSTSAWKPIRIVLSLAISIVVFTLLLKATVWFIGVPFELLATVSGGIILLVGLTLLFPRVWDAINIKLGLHRSEELVAGAQKKDGIWKDILLGAALGPVFSSCSPTYAIIVATVLPQSFHEGVIQLSIYSMGLAIPLLLIAFIGRSIIKKLKWLANPNGWFRRILGLLLVIVGLLIVSGLDKKVETYLVEQNLLGSTLLEQQLVDMTLPQAQTGTGSVIPARPLSFPFTLSYPAPELQGLTNWINSKPLTMSELKGKVVLVDFWTYSCINCIRTLPYMRDLQKKYADKGLVIIGVHAPEFAFEKLPENVQKAVKDYELTYPVAQDNDFGTWKAYSNRYWPAKYLIDKDGNVRYTHFGEGKYEETEKAIQALLEDAGATSEIMPGTYSTGIDPKFDRINTPEIYIGAGRQEHFGGGKYTQDQPTVFERPSTLAYNTFYLTGTWNIHEEFAELISDEGSIIIHYTAPKANIVLEGAGATRAEVLLDGKTLTTEQLGTDTTLENGKSISVIEAAKLYNFSKTSEATPEHVLEVKFLKNGVKAFAFTFG